MIRPTPPTPNIQQPVRRIASQSWFERLARLGYAAKGLVYFVVGLLAAQAAWGAGGRTTDTQGALQAIVTQPFGKFLLSLVLVGLIGYALWRSVQVILDPDQAGQPMDAKQLAQRVGYGLSAIAYFGLAAAAVKLLLGSGGSSGETSTQDWTARFLSQPFGQWLVGLAGLAVLCTSCYLCSLFGSVLTSVHGTAFEHSARARTRTAAGRVSSGSDSRTSIGTGIGAKDSELISPPKLELGSELPKLQMGLVMILGKLELPEWHYQAGVW